MNSKTETQYSARLIYVERSFVATFLETVFGALLESEHPIEHFARGVYRHYGVKISVGSESPRIFHYSGPTTSEVKVIESSVKEFEECSYLHDLFINRKSKYQHCDKEVIKFSGKEVFDRAKSSLGKNLGGYQLFTNNCEHFANWCVQGRRISHQFFLNPDQGENLLDEVKGSTEKIGLKEIWRVITL